jgi:predicted MPP superfamily phosphohydrolase
MVLATIGIVLGEVFLILDLANRIFGSYAHRPGRMLWRILVVTLCVLVLPAPGIVHGLGWGGAHAQALHIMTGAVGWLLVLHFLVPYKWGVERVPPADYHRSERPIGRGVLLRDSHLELGELPEGIQHLIIVALSDLHCTTHRKTQTLIHALEALDEEELFDLVLVLGDLGEEPALLPEVMQGLGSIQSRFGVYCVRGNHDFEGGRAPLIKELAGANGIHLLENAVYEVPGTGITLVGLELPWDKAPLPEAQPDRFVIGLSHTPDNIRRFSRLSVNVGFAGHTHGGRLRIPLLGSALVPGRLGRFLERGLFRLNGTLLYVTSGLGYHVARFGKKGEILRLTITRPHGAAAPQTATDLSH